MSYSLNKHISKKTEISIVDKAMNVASVIHPLMALPQVYDIYSTKDAGGVSLATWLGFMLLGLIFLLYGLIHRIRPFIVMQSLWFVVDFAVVLGVLIYR